MKIRPEQLEATLQKGLQPSYLISGAETLLANEAADSLRRAARAQGFTERQIFHADSIDWNAFLAAGQAMSLFAARRILELRLPSSRPGDKGSKALVQFAADPPADTLLLVLCGKLDRSQQRSKWVGALEKIGGHIQVWPVEPGQMPAWLAGRLRTHGLEADREALEVLAERVAGNLLAAQQEVEKLALLLGGDAKRGDAKKSGGESGGKIDAERMAELVTHSARYNPFALVDHCLAGRPRAALTHLQGLREEGTEAALILWALVVEVRQLAQIQAVCATGQSLATAMRSAGVWQKKQPLMQRAAQRTDARRTALMLKLGKLADQAIKSNRYGDPWLRLRSLTLALCGQPAFDLRLELAHA
ncbi:MAG: DNA polymerase III subunit delta [Cellvibrionales bacterium]|nr:DNA polymerase III subunit delta [Cellvibrionales bacterium]